MSISKQFEKKDFVRYKVAILIIYGCFLIALSFFKTTKIILPAIYQFESLLGGDKLTHLTLSSVLSILALWALMPKDINVRVLLLRCAGICLLLTSGLLIDELHQTFVGSRRFEWLDLAYGITGIGLGFGFYLVIKLPKLTHKH